MLEDTDITHPPTYTIWLLLDGTEGSTTWPSSTTFRRDRQRRDNIQTKCGHGMHRQLVRDTPFFIASFVLIGEENKILQKRNGKT